MAEFPLKYLGERAVVIEAPHVAPNLAKFLEDRSLHGVVDVVPAFSNVALYFDCDPNLRLVEEALLSFTPSDFASVTTHEISVCYELGEDTIEVCSELGISFDEFVALHSGRPYTCDAIGFCPGFPYLTGLEPQLAKLSRKTSPRTRVPSGSVAIVGNMTGIYPLERPGGWWLIGQTPQTIVDVEAEYFPISVGDRVQFSAISKDEFDHLVEK